MAWNRVQLRKLHRALAPIIFLPLLLTVITGVVYQILDGFEVDRSWLMALHKGVFGPLDLEMVYPFLNGFGLLVALITGLLLWLPKSRSHSKP